MLRNDSLDTVERQEQIEVDIDRSFELLPQKLVLLKIGISEVKLHLFAEFLLNAEVVVIKEVALRVQDASCLLAPLLALARAQFLWLSFLCYRLHFNYI